MKLGAGRATKEDTIDPNVGIVLNKKVSDYVEIDDILCYLYCNDLYNEDILNSVYESFVITTEKIEKPEVILEIIG